MHACTIVARNYLGFARVLAESFLAQHPDSVFSTLVIDAELGVADSCEPFAVISPSQLDLPAEEFHRMAVMYDVTELATALKPWLLRHLIEHGADAAVYIDPDIMLFSPIDDVPAMVAEHGIALTPHSLGPMPRDALLPSEADIMGSGVYNLGFIGVGRQPCRSCSGGRSACCATRSRLPTRCCSPTSAGSTSYRATSPHHIIRDPGFNVAYWNLDERSVTRRRRALPRRRGAAAVLPLQRLPTRATRRILSKYVATAQRVLLSERRWYASCALSYGDLLGRTLRGRDRRSVRLRAAVRRHPDRRPGCATSTGTQS